MLYYMTEEHRKGKKLSLKNESLILRNIRDCLDTRYDSTTLSMTEPGHAEHSKLDITN